MREHSLGARPDLGPSLPPALLARVAAAGAARKLAAHEILYRQGEAAHAVFVLRTGRVKASSVNAHGHETVLRVHLAGSLLGLTAIGGDPRRDATAIAMEPCEAVAISRARMLELMHADAALAVRIAQLLLERLSSFQFRVHEVLTNTVEQRLARALLAFGSTEDEQGMRPGISLSHEELANIVAARRPTVTQALRVFAAAGLIRLQRRRIIVLDPAGLERLIPCRDAGASSGLSAG